MTLTTCNFCLKSKNDVELLISTPTVAICNECIDMCVDTLYKEGLSKVPSIKPDVKLVTIVNNGITYIAPENTPLAEVLKLENGFAVVPPEAPANVMPPIFDSDE